MANQQIFTLTQDPLGPLKFMAVAVFLALPLTIGAYLVKARRMNVFLSFFVALAALQAGHFAAVFADGISGVVVALVSELATLCLGIRYLLVASGPASFAIGLVVVVLSVVAFWAVYFIPAIA
jgi:hypothetical protein